MLKASFPSLEAISENVESSKWQINDG